METCNGKTCLVLDIGGVVSVYSATKITSLSPRQMKNAFDSPAWHDFERGLISLQECNDAISEKFGLSLHAWQTALEQLFESLTPNLELIAAVRELKYIYPSLRVYGLSNMPKPYYDQLKPTIDSWNIFDKFYPTSELGARKPDIACFERFLERVEREPQECILVDDGLANILAARALGFEALHFDNTNTAIRTLHNTLGDSVERGLAYLHRNAGNMFSESTSGEIHRDNFSQLIILQCIGDRNLVTLERKGPLWNYFIGEPRFEDTLYPNDSDTTSLANVTLDDVPTEDKELAMKMILSNLNPDGMPYCWFEPSRPRFDHCICATVYRFFHLNNKGAELSVAHDHLCRLLESNAFELGSRYYESPDWLLFILSNLCSRRPNDPTLSRMRAAVVARIQDRMGCDQDILSAAMRLISAQAMGLSDPLDLKLLLRTQQMDGGWGLVWLWRYGKEKVKIGSRGVVTAMAVKGIRQARKGVSGLRVDEEEGRTKATNGLKVAAH